MLNWVGLFATSWTLAHQAPLSMKFWGQDYWSGCHFLLQQIFQTQILNLHLLHLLHLQMDSSLLHHLRSSSDYICIYIKGASKFWMKNWSLWVKWKKGEVNQDKIGSQEGIDIIHSQSSLRIKQYSCLENPRDGSPVGCRLWGHTESDMTDMT